MTCRHPFTFSLLLVCVALPCVPADEQTVIRTSVHLVEVSVIATASKGLPANGLGAADFRVLDNGKEQAIASFASIDSRAALTREQLPPNTWSNRLLEGPGQWGKERRPQVVTMILLDAVNTKIRNQTVARLAVERILEKIEPEERVAIYAFGSRLRTIHDFSSDKASLLARLKAYHGEVPNGDSLLDDLDLDMGGDTSATPLMKYNFDEARIVDTLETLEAVANHVKGVPGRKNLLWLSAAFPVTSGGMGKVTWRTFDPEMKRAIAALNAANVSVYPIDARGLSVNPTASINIGTMNDLASATGGKAYYDRNDLERGVRLALDDSREAYVLTYYPKNLTEDGAYHQIRIRCSRPGVQLRFRKGYYATAADEDGGGTADRLARAISSPLDNSEIGIQASVERGGGEKNEVDVVLHVDPTDLSLAHNTERWTGALHLAGIQIGAAGERYEGVRQTAKLDLRPEIYQRALEQGLRLAIKLKRNPAAVAVRVAVVDEQTGRVGSLSVPIRAGSPGR